MFSACRPLVRLLRAVLLCATALPGTVFAHPEFQYAAEAWAGFLHPWTGMDHVLAMIAVGLWAVQLGRSAIWALPTAFPFAMVVGALLAQEGVMLPAIEPMLGLSVLVIGLAVAVGLRLPSTLSAPLIGFFAAFHGHAHFTEAPLAGGTAIYAFGFLGATVLLHLVGLAGGMLLARTNHGAVWRLSGSAIAASGAALLML